jgi:hypothetical protein
VEETPGGRRLHVRVPLTVRVADGLWALLMAANGVEIELAGAPPDKPAR